MNLYIGSGDVGSLLMGQQTKGYQDLFRKFFSESKPNYNALASPIDALRTGAILEGVYAEFLGDGYYEQVVTVSKEMDVFKSSLDFAKIEGGEVVDFDELKTIWFTEYVEIIKPMAELSEQDLTKLLKRKFKKYYNQVQQQLYTSELDECNLVFLSVESYDDAENYSRTIKDEDVTKFRIKRDEDVISLIKGRGGIFQSLKDNFK